MDKQQIDASALYGFEAGLREGAGELERAQRRIAELERENERLDVLLTQAEDMAKRGLAAKQQVIEEAALAWERENAARENAEVSLRRAEGEKATLRVALSDASGHGWLSPEEAAELQAQVATLRAVIPELMDGMDTYYATLPEGDAIYEAARAALAGTGDEVGAVARAAVRWQQANNAGHDCLVCRQEGDPCTTHGNEILAAEEALLVIVVDLLAKQPAWEVRR